MRADRRRYNVYCTPCHSRVGNGAGMIVQRGYAKAGNFHTARLQAAPLGHFFNVITNGYGAMPDYSAQLTPADRWAVVAYIRALQLSQNAQTGDVAAGEHVQPLTDITEQAGLPAGLRRGVGLAAHRGHRHAQRRALRAASGSGPAGGRAPAHPSHVAGAANGPSSQPVRPAQGILTAATIPAVS